MFPVALAAKPFGTYLADIWPGVHPMVLSVLLVWIATLVLLRDVDIDALVEGPGVDPYVRGAAAELTSFRDRLVRDLKKHGALVLDVAPADLTPQLINRYLEIKARHLL